MFFDLPDPAKDVLVSGGALTVLGIVANFLWRIFSRSRVADVAERAERSQIGRLEAEIVRQTIRADSAEKRADLAYGERNAAIERGAEAVGKVSGLTSQVEGLTRELASMKLAMEAMQTLLIAVYGHDWEKRLTP